MQVQQVQVQVQVIAKLYKPVQVVQQESTTLSSGGHQQVCRRNLIMKIFAAMLIGSLFNSLNRNRHACRTVHLLCSFPTSTLPQKLGVKLEPLLKLGALPTVLRYIMNCTHKSSRSSCLYQLAVSCHLADPTSQKASKTPSKADNRQEPCSQKAHEKVQ